VHNDVELGIAPGSRQVLAMLAENGALAEFVRAGARILESACGPCIGQGFSPAEGAVSLRTFNRNFAGRSGTRGDKVYLVSPETAVASAIAGRITDGRALGIEYPNVEEPKKFPTDDSMLLAPLSEKDAAGAEVIRGSTIVPPPAGEKLPSRLVGGVVIKVGDKITTDDIMPAGALLKYRSNVPRYARHVFDAFNKPGEPTFAARAEALKESGKAGVIVAGDSYGQGSSREHAALCPMSLGVRVVIAKAIERIHQANLVNFGICPLTFTDPGDYNRIEPGDKLIVENMDQAILLGETVTVRNATRNVDFVCGVNLSPRQRKILSAGGLLNQTREKG